MILIDGNFKILSSENTRPIELLAGTNKVYSDFHENFTFRMYPAIKRGRHGQFLFSCHFFIERYIPSKNNGRSGIFVSDVLILIFPVFIIFD